jgi:hypothetical protein
MDAGACAPLVAVKARAGGQHIDNVVQIWPRLLVSSARVSEYAGRRSTRAADLITVLAGTATSCKQRKKLHGATLRPAISTTLSVKGQQGFAKLRVIFQKSAKEFQGRAENNITVAADGPRVYTQNLDAL